MELRGRTEGQSSYNYTQNGDRAYELTRVYGSVEVRSTKFLTGYLQFIDTHALGLPTHVIAGNMRDAFDFRQGYVELHGHPGAVPVEVFVGRQELKFGSERIIGISDWTNNSRSWDGVDARIGDKNRVDLFSTSVVTVYPTSLDKHGAGLTFHGAYGSITTWIPKVHLSPYLLFHTVRGVTSSQGVKGNEVEATFGSEVEGSLPWNFDYEANASLQRGSYSTSSIHAGQTFEKLAYTFEKLPWEPRIGGEFDYATGNNHANANVMATYDQSYPSNHNAFGLVDLFGYQNIRQERINLDLGPRKNLTLLFQGGFLNLAQENDSVYSSSASTTIKAPTGGFATTDLGHEFDASAKYVFHDYIVANVGVGHLFPGEVLLDNKHGAADTIGYFSLTYRFRVDKQAKTSTQ
ncbi:hypothetical protein GRAN_4814 [Granulicella sibirica]|uniref:Alginate export domain-containing protein n=2 Tax=Granulicella sibirica TaxID=2479048 RepID=A0A4Q0STA1_9BACT|nr:hypothetical protein GRAN_4814 [Granulicella sibirica]